MDIGIVSLFPAMFAAISQYGITGRAVQQQKLKLHYWNPRDFSTDKHRNIDDRPYGGGPGMVLMVEPLRAAIQATKQQLGQDAMVIYPSPQGKTLDHNAVLSLAQEKQLIFVAGRYEGIDQRLIERDIDQMWSVGDYVVSGGELPTMLIIDAITRQMPGVLGNEQSALQESFSDGLLEAPHYTRPPHCADQSVPEVLLSGDHQAIERWRLKQALGRTWQQRPDLLVQRELSAVEQSLLDDFIQENAAL